MFFYKLEIEKDSIISKLKNQLKWIKYYELDI